MLGSWSMAGAANDNKMSELQRLKLLEMSVGTLRRDLERVNEMLRLTPHKPRLKKQKGAIERAFILAQVEIGKIHKGKGPPPGLLGVRRPHCRVVAAYRLYPRNRTPSACPPVGIRTAGGE
jgi:hypothetical protein